MILSHSVPLKMFKKDFNLSENLLLSADTAFNCLSDPKLFGIYHPFLRSVEKNNTHSWIFEEKPPYMPEFVLISYNVDIRFNPKNRSFSLHSVLWKLVSIDIYYTILPNGNSCVVEEKVYLKSTLPVLFILKNLMIKAHRQLLKNAMEANLNQKSA